MKNLELIEEFKHDPQRRMTSSYFRSFNGILFNRVPKGSYGHDHHHDTWYPIFIYDEIGLMPHYETYSRLPSREYYRVYDALKSIGVRMNVLGKTVVTVDVDKELPYGMQQPLKLRNVPDRKQFIKDILNYYFSFTFPSNYSSYDNSSKMDIDVAKSEAYTTAWEYALTTFASKYIDNKKMLEASLNELCSVEDITTLGQVIENLKKQVKDDDLESAEETYGDLMKFTSSLGEAIHEVNRRIHNTANKCKSIQLCCPSSMLNTRRDPSERHPSFNSILRIENQNLLKGWGDFSSFLTRLGFNIPKAFGFDLNAENASTLSAFRGTSRESMLNFTHHLDRIVASQEAEAKPEPSNLYLG